MNIIQFPSLHLLRPVTIMMEERSNVNNSSALLRKTMGGAGTQKKTSKKCKRNAKHYFQVFQKLHALELEQELAKLCNHNKNNQSKHSDKLAVEVKEIMSDNNEVMKDNMETMMENLEIMEHVTKTMKTLKTN